MYPVTALEERQRELLLQAQRERYAQRLRRLQRAFRRASKAERRLQAARDEVLRARSGMHGA